MKDAGAEIQEALASQGRLVEQIEEAIAGMTDAYLREPECPGKWSIIEVIQHLADTELVGAFRLRMILAEPGSVLALFDQDAWARELGYRTRRIDDAIEQLRVVRRANLRLLQQMACDVLTRSGRVGDSDVTVGQLIQKYARHDQIHLRQIGRIKMALNSGQ